MSPSNGSSEVLDLAIPDLSAVEDDFLSSMEGNLVHHQEQLSALRGTLAQTITTVDERLTTVNRLLRVLNPPPPPASKRAKSKSKQGRTSDLGPVNSTGYGISLERAFEGAKMIRKVLSTKPEDEQFITQKEIYVKLGWDQGKGSSLFRYLRAIEFVRMAGTDLHSTREIFAILDDEAIDRAEADYRAALRKKQRSGRTRVAHEEAMQRVIAYLQQHRKVVGWVTIQNECNLSKATMQRCNEELQEKKLVRVSGEGGGRREIEWIGENN